MTPSHRRNPYRLSELLKRDLFSISERYYDFRYQENILDYLWGKNMMRMVLEVQCLAVALIVTSQVWILTQYGTHVFEHLVGDEIALPLLYLLAIIAGTMTYARPSYWRIAMSLTLYSVCIYFSMLVTNVAVKVLTSPALAQTLQADPKNSGVWVPWAIGFALHMQMCISSMIVAMVSIRDMYTFNPVAITGDEGSERASSIVIPPTSDPDDEAKKPCLGHSVVHI